eukprot:CAMPEP_0172510056 /NCGR_PEP_ID=MMETSP1066-20121228/225751_1 /TAXON_ID=671091 /ORGANISM="Coscinodiscus wailesii, Strain CCMP2513" /LENGTH=426 /DNA_ID=CAMNT_0013288855 /DNA_START=239 /DNA_END=1519 /DNA_ORIENTATION=-
MAVLFSSSRITGDVVGIVTRPRSRTAFVSTSSSSSSLSSRWRHPTRSPVVTPSPHPLVLDFQRASLPHPRRSCTRLYFGDSGFFGIGAPEVAVIALVGYFVLGPQELYKLTKEIGKFIQSIRTLGDEASKNFEEGMENQLQLTEIRKAQRELTDAFSFRRSINVEDEEVPFAERPKPEMAAAAAATVADGVTAPASTKKKVRRRIKKKPKMEDAPGDIAVEAAPLTPDVPDLTMPPATNEDQMREQRMEQLAAQMEQQQQQQQPNTTADDDNAATTDWFTASDESIAQKVLSQQQPPPLQSDEQSRFASQLSGDWNARVLQNEDKLSPLAMIMERLSILEEEKMAADKRLEEEFRLREDLEEKYYRDKRGILEEAAVQVQTSAYEGMLQEVEEIGGNVTTSNATMGNVTEDKAVKRVVPESETKVV